MNIVIVSTTLLCNIKVFGQVKIIDVCTDSTVIHTLICFCLYCDHDFSLSPALSPLFVRGLALAPSLSPSVSLSPAPSLSPDHVALSLALSLCLCLSSLSQSAAVLYPSPPLVSAGFRWGKREISSCKCENTHREQGQSSRISLETERGLNNEASVSVWWKSHDFNTYTQTDAHTVFLSHIKFHPSTHDFGETMKKTSEIFKIKQIIIFMVG